MSAHAWELRRTGDLAPVCARCGVAANPFTRMKGLLGRRELPAGEGLLIRPTFSVHTWFMRFPIDVVFLDKDLRVLRVVEDMGPWRMASRRGARAVLELASGEAAARGLEEGAQLRLAEVPA